MSNVLFKRFENILNLTQSNNLIEKKEKSCRKIQTGFTPVDSNISVINTIRSIFTIYGIFELEEFIDEYFLLQIGFESGFCGFLMR